MDIILKQIIENKALIFAILGVILLILLLYLISLVKKCPKCGKTGLQKIDKKVDFSNYYFDKSKIAVRFYFKCRNCGNIWIEDNISKKRK